MSDLFSRQTRSDALTVKSLERLVSLSISGDHFGASYRKTLALPDGTELDAGSFTVDRSLAVVGQEHVDFNGTLVSLDDWIDLGAKFSELWRDQNEKRKASEDQAAAAEAARWNALTPEQQQAEIDAAKAKQTPVRPDPTPLGP